MSTPTRLAGFAVALLAALGIGAGVGAAVGPEPAAGASRTHATDACEPQTTSHEADHGGFG